jgi:hypothetical protein
MNISLELAPSGYFMISSDMFSGLELDEIESTAEIDAYQIIDKLLTSHGAPEGHLLSMCLHSARTLCHMPVAGSC